MSGAVRPDPGRTTDIHAGTASGGSGGDGSGQDSWGRAVDSARARTGAVGGMAHVGDQGQGHGQGIAGPSTGMSHHTYIPQGGDMHGQGTSDATSQVHLTSDADQHDADPDQLELVGPCLRVRAKFDFVATDPSALSFSAGDVIEVITMLESGWWDGLLGAQRGWFPSNFVEDVLEGEGEGDEGEGDFGEHEGEGQGQGEYGVTERDNQTHALQSQDQGYRYDSHARAYAGMSETHIAPGPGGGRQQHQSHPQHLDPNAHHHPSYPPASAQYARPDTRQTARSSMFPRSVMEDDEYGTMNGHGYGQGSRHVSASGRSAYGGQEFPRYGHGYRHGDEYAHAADRARTQARSAMDINRDADFGMAYDPGYSHRRQETGGTIRSLQSGIHLRQDDRGVDDFGMEYGGQRNAAGRMARDRETTGETIRSGAQRTNGRALEQEPPRGPERRHESREDDWVPCLTPDGEVYYHNTLTGEESWHLPMGDAEEEDEDDMTDHNSVNEYPTPSTNARSSMMSDLPVPDEPHARSTAASIDDISRGVQSMAGPSSSNKPDTALVPPPSSHRAHSGNPPAVVSRRALREWYISSASRILSLFPPGQRHSMAHLLETVNDALREVLEAAVAGSAAEEEMSRASDLRSAAGFADAVRREDMAADALHIAHKALLKALRELLRAFGYIGPIDRIDGMPRPGWTSDMTLIGSIGVFASNVHAATTSKKASLAFTAQAPGGRNQGSAWQDVSRSAYRLRDVLGRFPDMVAAEAGTLAGEQPYGKELECWIGARGAGELCNGRWGFGGSSLFSKDGASRDEAKAGRRLDQAMVQEAKHVQAEFDSVIRGQDARRSSASTGPTVTGPTEVSYDDVLELLRIAERFNGAIHHVDIASIIDLDGEQPALTSSTSGPGETARNDDIRAYADFVEQGRLAVVDFDKATVEINELCAETYLALCNGAQATIPELSQGLASSLLAASKSLGAILAITAEQATLIDTTPIVGRIGHRSARFAAANASSQSHIQSQGKSGGYSGYSSEHRDRPESMSSLASRGSVRSRGSKTSRSSVLDGMRNRVRGIEDDFQDSEDLMDPHVQRAVRKAAQGQGLGRSGMSNSGSQSSLAAVTRTGQGRDASAESSSTSLQGTVQGQGAGHAHNHSLGGRTESDSGSLRGTNNRTSFMKSFMRGRSDSDAELRPNPRTKSKKLAKLLGDDVLASGLANQGLPPVPSRHDSIVSPRNTMGFSPAFTATPALSGMSRGGTSSMIPEVPPYLGDDYVGNELILDDKGGVKAGTLRALVVRLTQHGTADTAFTQAFMLTFRSFVDGDLLLDLLIQRYHVEPPEGLDEFEQTDWVKQKQTPIRLRVANCMRQWLDHHYQASEDEQLLDRIEHFASVTLVADGFESLSKTLLNIAARRRRGEEPNQRRIISGGVLSPPAPFLPRSMSKNPQLTDIHPVELARQLTIFEFQYFQRIKIVELLNRSWQEEDVSKAPTTRATIHMSNKVAAFITWSILQPKDVKGRGAIIKHWLSVYTECKNLNNFSTIASLCAGINSSPINRMKRTLETVTGKWLTLKSELDGFMDSTKNFSHYKETLKAINPPCVPFLGFYLTALIFIEDGNKDRKATRKKPPTGLTPSNSMSSLNGAGSPVTTTPGLVTPGTGSTSATTPGPSTATSASTGTLPRSTSLGGALAQLQEEETEDTPPDMRVVNFFKRGLAAEICRDVQQYQSQPYNLAKCRPVWEFIMKGLESVEAAGDLYDLSLVVEPREKEDEKV